ncbi:3-methylfumaryl-CoA hydratase [Humitalea rosea]|uniref:3-methylfumaryl-CoA hydratase n=1 Tax=Humitalea rosea TaxID=990373 RepID=A0A2W7I643_9PROT|nr:MaoC family dehydratase N-terminal domain-containing protein [Humitalea rosea]PZW42134.1 3-methylfumaryl-CoA hydratase [Humitalea rosea]
MNDMQGWIGRSRVVTDSFTAPAVRRIRALLDLPPDPVPDSLPAHWQAMFFPDIAPQSGLGPDGHPRKGEFLPPIPLPRRMFAGRRARFLAPLPLGAEATRTTTIAAITEKTGRTGPMVFVTLRHDIAAEGVLLVSEEQDVVYREAVAPGAASATAAAQAPPASAAWSDVATPDQVMLFRYSAITFNGHRIHYDADYVRGEEGYPALVVNGGLTHLLLAEAAARRGGPLAAFGARNMRPLFCGRAVTLAGDGDTGAIRLWAVDDAGGLAVDATAEFAA